MASEGVSAAAGPASLIVVDPNGHRTRVEIQPTPFKIGRQADSDLILRDSRASRNHAQIVLIDGEYAVEDLGSRHGVYVNGERVERQRLRNSDRIEFGVADSYQLVFALDGAELKRLMEQVPSEQVARTGAGANLAKLRAVLEVARTLQSSFSTDDVLNSVVDAALTVTGAERGFLLLRDGEGLAMKVARDKHGKRLAESDLRVPRRIIHRALQLRRELLSMNFDPQQATGEVNMEQSVAALDLRSVVCVPLVRIKTGRGQETSVLSAQSDTVGLLYMDSRNLAADLSGGNRELLQTLAIEASTVLENARLLEEEREKQKIEEELSVARTIQQSLLPRHLPSEGWFRACGSSLASHEVGGDYFDVNAVNESCWATVVADVSGKGVSSALLASLLQGAFLTATDSSELMVKRVNGLNRFLHERTEGGKYATIFYSLLDRGGRLRYINAGQCAPIVLSPDGRFQYLESTAMPVGILAEAEFAVVERQIAPGDRVVIYSDGVTEAENLRGEFFGRKQLRELVVAHAADSCAMLHDAVLQAVKVFTDGAMQADDITLVVVEYQPG